MRFVDECKFRVQAGNGGNGCAAFRREAFVPFGGPAGGDGGAGGHVVLVGDEGKSSLLDLTHAHLISAEHGENGRSRDQYGKAGRSEYVRVPVGTVVYDADSGELLGELLSHGQELVVAEGGKGGRGNKHFATPTDRAPKRAEPGTKGESRNLRLELRVMADVGLLGFPNTTLVPQLGVVRLDDWIPAQPEQTLVAADIPGLVPGAAEGAGLGIRFLRHLERTRALLHLIALDPAEDREPLADYHVVRDELARYSPELAARPEVIALSKGDLTETQEAYPELKAKFKEAGKELYLLSAPTHQGISDVLGALRRVMEQAGKEV